MFKIKPRIIISCILVASMCLSSFVIVTKNEAGSSVLSYLKEVIGDKEENVDYVYSDYSGNRFIVKYKNEASLMSLKESIKDKIQDSKEIKNKNYSVITTKDNIRLKDLNDNIKLKNLDSDIEYIQPDYPVSLSSSDTNFSEQWAMYNNQVINANDSNGQVIDLRADINVVPTWEKTKGEGITVALLDTGVDIDHEDLKENIYINQNEKVGDGKDQDSNGYVDDTNGWNFVDDNNIIHDSNNVTDEQHGTHVAGILGAMKDNDNGITGVAPAVKILPLKVFSNGIAYTSDIIDAIHYAEAMGAKIVNCSWGSNEYNAALEEVINSSNMLFVCAAGNNSEYIDEKPIYPACYDSDNIITVGAMNKNGALSNFSNYGKESVDVAAPGEDIISTIPNNRYRNNSGTSMAAAFVSGEAALVISNDPNLSPKEVKGKIVESSERFSTLIDKVSSGRKINCTNAINCEKVSYDQIISLPEVPYNKTNGALKMNNVGYSLYSTSGTWSSGIAMPGVKNNPGAAEVNGKIYVIGESDFTTSNFVYEFNPKTNVWTSKAVLTKSRINASVAAINNKIYIIGGISLSWDSSNHSPTPVYETTVEEYDPINNTVVKKASMPVGRICFSVVAMNGKIYVIGGSNGISTLNSVLEYDPSKDTWVSKANMISTRGYFSVSALNGKIYAIGGNNSGTTLKTVEEFDPVQNIWRIKKDLNTGRAFSGTTVVNGKILVMGGNDGSSKINTVEEYDSTTDTWSGGVSMPTARSGFASLLSNGKVYVIGGNTSAIDIFTLNPNSAIINTSIPVNDDYGNEISSAKLIATSGTVAGEINYAGDSDVFKFTPSATGTYTIQSTGQTDTCCYVYDSNGNAVTFNDDSYGTTNFSISYDLTANSTYYFKVQHYSSTSIGTYNLAIGPSTTYKSSKQEFNLNMTASTVRDFSKVNFTVIYNPNELDVIDLCGLTQQVEMNSASLANTNILLKTFKPGFIQFTLNTSITSGKEWSGVVNAIKFKSKVTKENEVTYMVQ